MRVGPGNHGVQSGLEAKEYLKVGKPGRFKKRELREERGGGMGEFEVGGLGEKQNLREVSVYLDWVGAKG